MPLPDALVIGPMKAGTTWIYRYLANRGDVCLPAGVKETFFFDQRWTFGISWYTPHFQHFEPVRHRRIMEIAPSYFHVDAAAERIRDTCGEIPVIVTLRDPVKRAWSHYLHLRTKGYTAAPLGRALDRHPEIINASRYVSGIQRWRNALGRRNVHALIHDDLADYPTRFAEQLCDAVDLPFEGIPEECHGTANAGSIAPSVRLAAFGRNVADRLRDYRLYWMMNAAKRLGLKHLFFGTGRDRPLPEPTAEEKAYLVDELTPQLDQLEQILSRRFDAWRHSEPASTRVDSATAEQHTERLHATATENRRQ